MSHEEIVQRLETILEIVKVSPRSSQITKLVVEHLQNLAVQIWELDLVARTRAISLLKACRPARTNLIKRED